MLKLNFSELDERTDGIDQDFNKLKDKVEEALEKLENSGDQEKGKEASEAGENESQSKERS